MASRASDRMTGAPPRFQPHSSTQPEWGPPPATVRTPENQLADPIRRLAFKMGLVLIFLRFSMLHQVLSMKVGAPLPILYVFGIPAMAGIVLSGGIHRVFNGRPAVYWSCFAAWMLLATPFSWWKAGSLHQVFVYFRTDFIMLFVMAGLAMTWRECRLMLHVIAWGAVVNLLSARLFQSTGYQDRVGLDFGSIANPNDYACHLILTLPFLLWVGLSSKSQIVRLGALCGVAYGIYVILGTASRGAALALGVVILFFFLRGTMRQRIALAALAPIGLAILLMAVPGDALKRIRSFSAGSEDVSPEALASSESREYLLRKSISYSLDHPIFGIGPGQFSAYEGTNNQVIGTHGLWHETHNTYTQVASECGLPALLFFLAGIISTFLLLDKTYKKARQRPGSEEIATALSCMMLAMVGFCTAITFLSFAYFFYLPAMAGLSIAIWSALAKETVAAPDSPATRSELFGGTTRRRNVLAFAGRRPRLRRPGDPLH